MKNSSSKESSQKSQSTLFACMAEFEQVESRHRQASKMSWAN